MHHFDARISTNGEYGEKYARRATLVPSLDVPDDVSFDVTYSTVCETRENTASTPFSTFWISSFLVTFILWEEFTDTVEPAQGTFFTGRLQNITERIPRDKQVTYT